jgi:hypothetical protein
MHCTLAHPCELQLLHLVQQCAPVDVVLQVVKAVFKKYSPGKTETPPKLLRSVRSTPPHRTAFNECTLTSVPNAAKPPTGLLVASVSPRALACACVAELHHLYPILRCGAGRAQVRGDLHETPTRDSGVRCKGLTRVHCESQLVQIRACPVLAMQVYDKATHDRLAHASFSFCEQVCVCVCVCVCMQWPVGRWHVASAVAGRVCDC